jgi:hypothetical protein
MAAATGTAVMTTGTTITAVMTTGTTTTTDVTPRPVDAGPDVMSQMLRQPAGYPPAGFTSRLKSAMRAQS